MHTPSLVRLRSALYLAALCSSIILFACKGKSTQDSAGIASIGNNTVCHAQYFGIEPIETGGHRVWILASNCLDTLQQLVLLSEEQMESFTPRGNETVITLPVTRLALLSDTFVGALEILDAREYLIACADTATLYDQRLRQRAREGHLSSVMRNSMQPDREMLLYAAPQVVVANQLPGSEEHLLFPSESEISIVYCQDWLETSLLGRAEWLKLFGLLVGKASLADSIFHATEERYSALRTQTARLTEKPSILFGQSFKGNWHLPSGESYVANMIQDAGGTYNAPQGSSSSQPIAFEEVLYSHRHDDIWLLWLHGESISLSTLGKSDERYRLFDAFQKRQVYTNDARSSRLGNNDYWEQGPYKPDILLRDLINIFHPQLLNGADSSLYWRRLE